MPNPHSPARLFALVGVFSLPSAVVLALLVLLVGLPVWAGLAGLLAAALLSALLVRPVLTDADALSAWVRALAEGADAPPPRIRGQEMLGGLVRAVTRLRQQSQVKEAELAQAARWLESLLDNLPDPLLLLDAERRVARANRAARSVFGREMTGRDLAFGLRDPAVLEAADAVLVGGQVSAQAEFTQATPVERTFRVQVERLGPASPDGAVIVLALNDLTAVRRMERMRADFVANASHELRTPLATLLGFIETLKGPARDDAAARERFLDIMFEQASRMSRLVGDLLSLSRIELNEHSPPSDSVDVARVVAGVADALAPLAAAKAMRIAITVADGIRPVLAQNDELAQLVQNLIDNAVKYGRDGTTVDVTIRPADPLPENAGPALQEAGGIAIAVADRGEGIAREHLPRLTERFYRVDTARSRTMGGTGLGLAIVKHIVNRHRGHLAVESEPGRGSVFTVVLPCAPREAP